MICCVIDSKNLYGLGFSQYLPNANIEFDKRVSLEKLLSTAEIADTGYVMEVDTNSTDKARKISLNIPFCPEKKKLPISEYTSYIKSTNLNYFYPTKKLICDQSNEKTYFIKKSHLKVRLSQGIESTKVHRIVIFRQERWLKFFIIKNNKKATKDEFLEEFCKQLFKELSEEAREFLRNWRYIMTVESDDTETMC